ncbi:MAG: hypothetical protein HY975_02740 [Candidatus Kerfeldbacteria bacterium]|nr:hypothetical protein [Candidatus Kerfeldbacteria bacterium]
MFGYTPLGVLVAIMCVMAAAGHAVALHRWEAKSGDTEPVPGWLKYMGWAGLVVSAIVSPMHILTPALYAVVWAFVAVGLDQDWQFARRLAVMKTVGICVLAGILLQVASITHNAVAADRQESVQYWDSVPKYTITASTRVGQAIVIRFAETDSVIVGRVLTYDVTEKIRLQATRVQVGRGTFNGHTYQFYDAAGKLLIAVDDTELYYLPSSLDQ